MLFLKPDLHAQITWLEVLLLFHVYALVGTKLASAFCACTTVTMPGIDPEVVPCINP